MKHRVLGRAHEKGLRETRVRHRAREQIFAMPARNNHRSNHQHSNKPDGRDIFCRLQDAFRIVAHRAAAALGTAWAFMAALAVIVIWALTGHIFHYSDTWQLIINTGTTIVTFLMVFLIQNTQNRDSKAIQLKLDEIIRSIGTARNRLMDLETLSDDELDKLQKEFARLRKRAERAGAAIERVEES
jgi:low affinity Fe/Cu permease